MLYEESFNDKKVRNCFGKRTRGFYTVPKDYGKGKDYGEAKENTPEGA